MPLILTVNLWIRNPNDREVHLLSCTQKLLVCGLRRNTPFQDKLKTFRVDGRVLGPTVGAWCETSTDFDLLVELIAHALADEETSTIQVAHHQSVARQKCKLVADFGVRMHLA